MFRVARNQHLDGIFGLLSKRVVLSKTSRLLELEFERSGCDSVHLTGIKERLVTLYL